MHVISWYACTWLGPGLGSGSGSGLGLGLGPGPGLGLGPGQVGPDRAAAWHVAQRARHPSMAVGAWVWKTKPKPLKPTQREPTQRDRRHGSRSDLDRSPPERTGASPVFTCRDSWPVWKGAVWQRTHGEACAWASGPSGRAPYGNVRMVTWSVWRSVCCIDQVLPRPHVLHRPGLCST